MTGGFSLLVLLASAVPLGVVTLLLPSMWRAGLSRKLSYILLLSCESGWFMFLQRLFPLVGMPLIWQFAVEGVFLALVVATLVPLYRHRHDPDVDVP